MYNFFKKNLDTKHNSTQGFTLVEFIVIMSIFAIMVGVSLFNFSGFRSAATLENLAHDIALSIRKVQIAAGATRSVASGPGAVEKARGIVFTKSEGVGFSNTFTLFQDEDEYGYYDNSDTKLDEISIQTNDIISNIGYSEGSSSCDDNVKDINGDVSVLFRRYNTIALFSAQDADLSSASCIKITLKGADADKTKSIVVSKIGQVSVQ
jgi:Tfp pilus assembly protein FimT